VRASAAFSYASSCEIPDQNEDLATTEKHDFDPRRCCQRLTYLQIPKQPSSTQIEDVSQPHWLLEPREIVTLAADKNVWSPHPSLLFSGYQHTCHAMLCKHFTPHFFPCILFLDALPKKLGVLQV
jgi:hypothetical protein